jgi:CheY-like chemotaxis protein
VDLCRAYDGLLEPGGAPFSAAAHADLATFAKVLDLDLDLEGASAAEIWRQVRPQLAQEFSSTPRDPGSTAPTGFQPKVFLPAARGDPDRALPLEEATGGLNLLLVEDDPDLSAAIMDALTEGGHRVVAHAATAQRAIGQAALHLLDLAIVDVSLADGSSGVEVAKSLRNRWGVPVLFLSGGRNEHLVQFDTAVGFLGKPFAGSELLAAITLATPLLDRR